MDNSKGKIIAVVGSPRSGKSFLSKILADHYNADVFIEDANVFPARILEDLAKNVRPLERSLWFRNQLVRKYREALVSKKEDRFAILDNFWLSWQLYLGVLDIDFEAELLREVADFDREILGWPDIIIFLKVRESSIRKFIKLGGRDFDQMEEYITKQVLPVNRSHQKFFENNTDIPSKVIVLERDDMDFLKQDDLKKLILLIEN